MDTLEYFKASAPGLIGFLGVRRSGKTEAAIHLAQKYGYKRIRVAQPLKDALMAMGLTHAEVDGDLKEEPCELLCGHSPRHAMQTLGTEWGRHMIGEDLWLNAWVSRIKAEPLVVADDIRFPNEAEALKRAGGILVRINRPGTTVDDHISEKALAALKADITIDNSGDIEHLRTQLDALAWGNLKSPPIVEKGS